jgi:hypothetical protein
MVAMILVEHVIACSPVWKKNKSGWLVELVEVGKIWEKLGGDKLVIFLGTGVF